MLQQGNACCLSLTVSPCEDKPFWPITHDRRGDHILTITPSQCDGRDMNRSELASRSVLDLHILSVLAHSGSYGGSLIYIL